jgi:anthranilate synthase component 1
MRIPCDLAVDLDTPLSAYLKLAPLGPRFLLEFAPASGRGPGHAILGLGAATELVLDGRGLRQDGRVLARPDCARELLAHLRAALERAPRLAAGEDPELPFHGGLVGLLGFDLARRFADRPGARPPAEPELHLLAPRALLVFDLARRGATVLSAGAEERAGLLREVRRLLAGPVPPAPRRGRATRPEAVLARGDFAARAARAQEAIRDGEIYQLVLSTAFRGETDLAPVEIYRALRFLNPSPFQALFELGDLAVVSASPEALVRLRGGRAELQPIAGTRPRGADGDRDRELERELLADAKEAAEHVMLVDLARDDLGRVARPGSVHVGSFRAVERYSHVMHLVSAVHGELAPGADAFDCLAACFPAGTVVGAPKGRALAWLDELEPEPRGLYGGSFGTFGHGGTMQQALTIRTLFVRDGAYRFQAGAGVVADSSPAAEYDEVLAKGAALARALELATEER